MSLQIRFENHLTERVVEVFFEDGFSCNSTEDLNELKKQWTENLKKWHSPYTCLFDCRKIAISEEFEKPFAQLVRFFQNFFMKKIIGFIDENETKPKCVPFDIFYGYESATKQTGLSRTGGLTRDLSELRSRIQIDNDFNAHVMEISFLAETDFANAADIRILRQKLQNILMLWHTPYSVVFNVANCTFQEEAKHSFPQVERFLKGFFCKTIIGYAPKEHKDSYPFPVFRSRHKAVGKLGNEGLSAGDAPNCATRKSTPGSS